MSLLKIEGLLEQSKIVDGNIISDSLSNILQELCQLVTLQGDQIKMLMENKTNNDQEMSRFITREEYNEEMSKLNNTLSNINTSQLELKTDFSANIEQQVNNLEAKINTIQNNLTEGDSKIEKDVEFQTTLLNKLFTKHEGQLKQFTNDFDSLKGDVEHFTKEIKSLKNSPVKDVLSQIASFEERLSKIPEQFDVLENNFRTSNISLVQKVNDLTNNMTKFEEQVRHELIDIRRMIVDFPTFTVDGKLDTPSLINAVNRDTRRIDSFNEMISTLGNNFNGLLGKFELLETHFHNMEYSMCEFSNVVQNTTNSLSKRSDTNHAHVKQLGKELKLIYENISNFARQSADVLEHDTNVLTKIITHVEKVTNRPFPNISGYDEFYHDQNDLYNSIGKCSDDFNKTIFRAMKSDFDKVPEQFIYLPSNEVDDNYKALSAEKAEENRKQAENSANQRIENLNKRLSIIADNLNDLHKYMEEQLRQKANADYTDRMFEKLKYALDKQRDYVSDSISTISNANSVAFTPVKVERPSTVTGQRLIATRKSAGNVPTIASHDLLYGKRSVISSPLVGRK